MIVLGIECEDEDEAEELAEQILLEMGEEFASMFVIYEAHSDTLQ